MIVTNLIIAIAGASLRLTPVCSIPVDQFTSSAEDRTPPSDPAIYYQTRPSTLFFKEPLTCSGPDDKGDRFCLALEILSSNEVRYVRGKDVTVDCFNLKYRPSDFIDTPLDSIAWDFDAVVPASDECRARWPKATRMLLRWSVGLNRAVGSSFVPIEDKEPAVESWSVKGYIERFTGRCMTNDFSGLRSVCRLDEDNYRETLSRIPDEDVKACVTLARGELARRQAARYLADADTKAEAERLKMLLALWPVEWPTNRWGFWTEVGK